ncbi:hypothetical protein BC938DRAFT_472109 [Jimgerdemannia flammicorona]|uniref:Uncharacterized protein n=1 Tax=Jimgerdemannia flammicorona TaxID=994334 RepID=A0A433QUA5_9FUNG|nr:hypothetical protein BC938DRAFT_472109 [Jimgerdemannia flammicorona]
MTKQEMPLPNFTSCDTTLVSMNSPRPYIIPVLSILQISHCHELTIMRGTPDSNLPVEPVLNIQRTQRL